MPSFSPKSSRLAPSFILMGVSGTDMLFYVAVLSSYKSSKAEKFAVCCARVVITLSHYHKTTLRICVWVTPLYIICWSLGTRWKEEPSFLVVFILSSPHCDDIGKDWEDVTLRLQPQIGTLKSEDTRCQSPTATTERLRSDPKCKNCLPNTIPRESREFENAPFQGQYKLILCAHVCMLNTQSATRASCLASFWKAFLYELQVLPWMGIAEHGGSVSSPELCVLLMRRWCQFVDVNLFVFVFSICSRNPIYQQKAQQREKEQLLRLLCRAPLSSDWVFVFNGLSF